MPDIVDTLFEAVFANPDDDAALLVLADALSERGDPLGEFITIQVQASPLRAKGLALLRERALLDEHRRRWAPPATRFHRFRRGLLRRCQLTGPTDPDHRGWRSLDRLELLLPPDLPAPTALPFRGTALARLVDLNGLGERDLADFVAEPRTHLRRLRLHASVQGLLGKHAPRLAEAFPGLTHLAWFPPEGVLAWGAELPLSALAQLVPALPPTTTELVLDLAPERMGEARALVERLAPRLRVSPPRELASAPS
jgi:uncharacterized protein (TIGR02996 family)